jgi:transcriptional regulator with XRE-family HTH domain
MFDLIEARRERAGISQLELCRRAGIHPTSYSSRKNGRSQMREESLAKLERAMSALIDEKRKALADAA